MRGELALAHHRYVSGGSKVTVELGAVGLARLPVSPRFAIDVRLAGLKTVAQPGLDRTPPGVSGLIVWKTIFDDDGN